MTPFNSQQVIEERVNEPEFCSYLVGFDLADDGQSYYRLSPLVQKILSALHEFCFGYHEGSSTDNTETLTKLIESAQLVYKIDSFRKIRELCQVSGYNDDDIPDKYLKRGEFGELILHLLLRDFHSTIPLLSKIYFKDSVGHAVHGFDSVHIDPVKKELWLGESKLYTDAKNGIKELINDVSEHFNNDYINAEFTLISKKIKGSPNTPELDYWLDMLSSGSKLSDRLSKINIPLLCTYTCDLFYKHSDENSSAFTDAYETKVTELKKYFDDHFEHPWKNRLNIILLLFPVQSKLDLVKSLHLKLTLLQSVGE
ncbi:HamA C-terminal domain-containing protein [Kluyvera sichuanensis]